MAMSRARLDGELRRLQQERRRLLRLMTKPHPLAVGTVAEVHRKCGNPNCRCASGPAHPQTLFLFKDAQGRRRCKLVRRADENRLLLAGQRYVAFREAMKRLRAIDKREKQILVAIRDSRAIEYE